MTKPLSTGKTFVVLLSGVVFFLINSCSDDTVLPSKAALYAGFYPLQQGSWIAYDVDSIVHLDNDDYYDLDTSIESYHFQVKEQIDSSFIDGVGELTYRISRYRRLNDTLPWSFMNLWTAKRTLSSVQRVEDNIRYVKMAFPIDKRKTWNGNAYNMFEEEDYSYADIYSSLSMGGFTFDSTVTVVQNDFVSNINRILKKEIYANHIGMIYKQRDSLNTLNLPSGSVLILNGFEYKLTVNSYLK